MPTMILRFFAIMFVALSMGMAFCHLLEMPVRLGYEPGLWSRVTNVENTYAFFGPPVGASIEGAAWISAAVLAFLVRGIRRDFPLTFIGALLMISAHAAWWLFVFPVNSEMVTWTPDTLPENFAALRQQWEFTHGVRAVLQIGALGCLVAAALASPGRRSAS